MPSRPPVQAFPSKAFLLAGVLLLSSQATESCNAAALPSPAVTAATQTGSVGKLTHLGEYPGGGGNHTVTALPDGRLLFYGVPLDVSLPMTGTVLTIRNRQELGVQGHELVGPRLWDPERRG